MKSSLVSKWGLDKPVCQHFPSSSLSPFFNFRECGEPPFNKLPSFFDRDIVLSLESISALSVSHTEIHILGVNVLFMSILFTIKSFCYLLMERGCSSVDVSKVTITAEVGNGSKFRL